jgi:hypothetical protein
VVRKAPDSHGRRSRGAGKQRFARKELRRHPADDLDDNIDVAGKEIVEPIGPEGTGDGLGMSRTLFAGAAIGDGCHFEAGD